MKKRIIKMLAVAVFTTSLFSTANALEIADVPMNLPSVQTGDDNTIIPFADVIVYKYSSTFA